MANIFKLTKGYVDKPKRNVYDLSYTSNITCNFGTLYPVFCKEVNPGDSMSIDTSFGLRAQPMIFPIQTRMRADVHYFYVRNRTLWKDWMDFYGKTKDNLIHPYIDRNISDFKTGSIYDYLGVPTTVMSDGKISYLGAINPYNYLQTQFSNGKDIVSLSAVNAVVNPGYRDPLVSSIQKLNSIRTVTSLPIYVKKNLGTSGSKLIDYCTKNRPSTPNVNSYICPSWLGPYLPYDNVIDTFQTSTDNRWLQGTWLFPDYNLDYLPETESFSPGDKVTMYVAFYMTKSSWDLSDISRHELVYTGIKVPICQRSSGSNMEVNYYNGFFRVKNDTNIQGPYRSQLDSLRANGYDLIIPLFMIAPHSDLTNDNTLWYKCYYGVCNIGGSVYLKDGYTSSRIIDSSEMTYLPWCGTNKSLKINALPYRAYQAIYNSFYRNVQNDPFFINGVAEYNKYITNDEGGADQYPYQLYQRNWELDFLTSAVQSPQQGLAPLVGVTINNKNQQAIFEFRSAELEAAGVPEGKVKAITTIGEAGDVTGISYYDPELPQSNLQNLMTAINYGISINDIRQTNALQRWLEKNIRRGYRYRDQLMSHFGVNVSFNELLMPEFIGGCSQDVETQTIYQTVTNESGYLGDFAGRGSVVGNSRNRVSKYCDEAGFIIGIMSIVPIPVYSQVPAGYCFHNDLLDYYFPEFGKIGMQPIYNYHVTPLQSSPTDLNSVFGYQRPWWHLISSVDEVHGEFRSTANGYLIHRQFAETPQLNGNFLKIDNAYINDVFAITNPDVSNQFLGVINFHVTKKTAIPLHGEPSIE